MLRELDLGSKAKEKDHEVAVNTKRHIQGLPLGGVVFILLSICCSFVVMSFLFLADRTTEETVSAGPDVGSKPGSVTDHRPQR